MSADQSGAGAIAPRQPQAPEAMQTDAAAPSEQQAPEPMQTDTVPPEQPGRCVCVT